MAAEHFTTANFAEKTKGGVALVDFWAPWCSPCRGLTPVIEELAKDYAGKATIGKVNCDEEPELAQKFNVMSIPAIFVLKDGQVVGTIVGARPKKDFATALDKALAN